MDILVSLWHDTQGHLVVVSRFFSAMQTPSLPTVDCIPTISSQINLHTSTGQCSVGAIVCVIAAGAATAIVIVVVTVVVAAGEYLTFGAYKRRCGPIPEDCFRGWP